LILLRILRAQPRVVRIGALTTVVEICRLGVNWLALEVLSRVGPRGLKRLHHLARSNLRVVSVGQVGEILSHLVRWFGRELDDLFQ